MKKALLLLLTIMIVSCNANAQKTPKKQEVFPVVKTEAQWKLELTQMQYFVLREAGTERAFSSDLNKNYTKGTYHCQPAKHLYLRVTISLTAARVGQVLIAK
jgi:peptide-methionine (R)-S-oxide reductase